MKKTKPITRNTNIAQARPILPERTRKLNCGRFVCSSRYLQYANERQQVQQSRKYKRHQSLKGKTKTFYYNNENILVLTVSLGPLTVGESLQCVLNFVHFFSLKYFL